MLLEVHRAQLLVDSHLHICIHLHTCIPVPKLPKTPTPETAETESFQTTSRGMTDIQLSSTRCNGELGFTFNHPLCSHGECRLRTAISYRPSHPQDSFSIQDQALTGPPEDPPSVPVWSCRECQALFFPPLSSGIRAEEVPPSCTLGAEVKDGKGQLMQSLKLNSF